jgi:U4/U6.U5 tri-snRNP-associated protein 1
MNDSRRSYRSSDSRSHRSRSSSSRESRSQRDEQNTQEDVEMTNDRKIAYKPQVTSSDGSMSMSIEETNKLRISLGLKPLQVNENEREVVVEQKEENDTEEVTKRIEFARFRRKERELLRTKGLADDSDEDDDDQNQILSFVQKQREMAKIKRQAEEKAKQLLEEELQNQNDQFDEKKSNKKRPEYNENDVKGLTVAHDLSNLENVTGETGIILTLQDRGVLEDGEDALENITLYEKEKRDWNKVNTKKLGAGTGVSRGAYDAISSLENEEQEDELLSQYNEDKQELKRKTFVIGDVVDGKAKKRRESDKQAIQQNDKTVYDLEDAPKPVIAQDFALPEEKKKKQKNIKVKKRQAKSSTKKRTSETEVTVEALAPIEDQSKHRGKRRQYSDDHMDVEEEARKQDRDRNFQRALDKAHERARVLNPQQISFEEEEDALIRSKLGNLQRNVQRVKVEELVQQSVEQAIQREEQEKNSRQSSGVIFNPLTEFARSVDIKQEEEETVERRKKLYEENDMKKEDDAMETQEDHASIVKKRGKNIHVKKRGTFDENEQESVGPSVEVKQEAQEEENEDEQDESAPLLEEPEIGSGIAAALQFAQQKGLLTAHEQDYSGRNRDRPLTERERKTKRPFNVFQTVETEQEENDDIDLERVDKFGRRMTQKQAFRELSHHFHGIFPGKNKKEKELKRFQEEMKRKQMADTDTPLKAMEHHEKVTQALQQPYVLVDSANLAAVAKASKQIQKENAQAQPKRKKQKTK